MGHGVIRDSEERTVEPFREFQLRVSKIQREGHQSRGAGPIICWKKVEVMKLTKLRSNQVKQGELSEVKQNVRGCNKELVYCVP